MQEISYQKIFDCLLPVLPDDWKKAVFYAEYSEGSYSMKYYVDSGDGDYIDCFSTGISKSRIIHAFLEIDKEIAPIRNSLSTKDLWSVMTLTVSSSGEFNADYDYEQVTDSIEYFRKWETRYLRKQ